MFVLIKGKVYNSDDVPIMYCLTADETSQFKSQPDNVDTHCSYPPTWQSGRGQAWMNENKEKLWRAKKAAFTRMDFTKVPSPIPQQIPQPVPQQTPQQQIPIPPPMAITVETFSDDDLLKLVKGTDDSDFESFDDPCEEDQKEQ